MIVVSWHFTYIGLSVSNDETGDGFIQESILNLFPLIMLLTRQTLSFPDSLAMAHGQSDLETITYREWSREHRMVGMLQVLETDLNCPNSGVGRALYIFGEHIYLFLIENNFFL